jgi:hypothetical protein
MGRRGSIDTEARSVHVRAQQVEKLLAAKGAPTIVHVPRDGSIVERCGITGEEALAFFACAPGPADGQPDPRTARGIPCVARPRRIAD